MNKIFLILIVFIIILFSGCRTIEYVYPEYELPDEPLRETIEPISTLEFDSNGNILNWLDIAKELGLIMNYYDSLVSEWELWADTTKTIIRQETDE